MSNLNSVEALELQLQNHQPKTTAYIDIIHQLVVLYLNIDLDKANYWINEAEKLASQINYQESIGLCLHFRGVSHYQLSDYEIALDYFLKADKILSKSDSWRNRIKAKANIGLIYHQTHQYQEALRVFFDIEKEISSYPEDLTHAQLYVNIDNAYCSLNDPINGSKYTKKALSIATQLDNKYGLAICHSNLAGHYILMNNIDGAIEHLNIAKIICENENYLNILDRICTKYVDCFIKLKDYEKAIEYSDIGFELAGKINNIENQTFILKYKMDIYENLNDYKTAFEVSKEYIALKEKMLDSDKIKSLNALQLKYETEKKEAALSQLKLDQANSELTALKSQMNPHFIFNALNSIQELFMIGDKKMANEQMGNFAQLTRKILDLSGKQSIYLAEEIEILTMYLELESMRFENSFTYKIYLPKTIDEDYIQLPPMLIQPYVENCMKHGLLHQKGQKQLDIFFEINEDESILTCVIDDNGIGRTASAEINKKRPKSHVSFSTSATEKRLQLLNQGKQETIAVVFEDKMDENKNALGTKVSIQIPIN